MDGTTALTKAQLSELVDHMTSCLTQTDHKSVMNAIRWMQSVTGFGQAAVARVSNVETREVDRIECHYGDEKWKRIYLTNHFGRVDPVIAYAVANSGTFLWRQAYEQYLVSEASDFIESARDNGIVTGVTSSVYIDKNDNRNGLLLFSIANVPELRISAAFAILNAMAPAIIDAVAQVPQQAKLDIEFTAREREVLGWAGDGKGVWEISRILSISESTVKFHLQNIYKKLDVANRPHAIAKAIQHGFL